MRLPVGIPTSESRSLCLSLSTLALLLLLTAGCNRQPEIRDYTVPRETKRLFTSDVIRDQFPTIPLRWDVPESWTEAEADQFSRMAWTTGPAAREARITVTDLPGAAGVEPQLVRWRRQLSLPPAEPQELMQDAEPLKITNGEGTWVDLEGPADSILAAIVSHEGKLWVVRFRGPNATASEEKETFRNFCESLALPKARRS